MELSQQRCIPSTKGVVPMGQMEIQEMLPQLPGWQLQEDGKALFFRKKFKNFKESLDFINRVGEIAESENHHPDIEFGWGYAELTLQSHSIGGLHVNDFIVAAKINALLKP